MKQHWCSKRGYNTPRGSSLHAKFIAVPSTWSTGPWEMGEETRIGLLLGWVSLVAAKCLSSQLDCKNTGDRNLKLAPFCPLVPTTPRLGSFWWSETMISEGPLRLSQKVITGWDEPSSYHFVTQFLQPKQYKCFKYRGCQEMYAHFKKGKLY